MKWGRSKMRIDEKTFIMSLKESEYKNYEYVKSADKLILFAIDLLEKNHVEPRFDHIVISAFKLFPKKFSMPLYSEYPDALRVDHCLLHCSYGNKWLDGSIKQGYKLNETGRSILEGFLKEISQQKKEDITHRKVVNRKEKAIIDQLIKSKAYSYFLNNKLGDLDADYIKEALRCTPAADEETIKNNIKKIENYAKDIGADKKIFDFINKIRNLLELK